ncbi:PREDICTED: alpha-N-acetylgalactosaminidase-like [Acropora digitifera]|uniref:alpha-N-acetylgalactosaminidase-like n=1 Tax=Acropora digitifera TaxID=70779 RepID=UPI00077A8CDE|nr:PREDICTED: alpha-N-acetylgalactosaminidase-like [Acropora digitifera]
MERHTKVDVSRKAVLFCLFLCVTQEASSLDNGLALTPPMGWMSWERFRCVTDCENDPRNCISERLYMEMADAMVYGGFREAGYQYVCIDPDYKKIAKHCNLWRNYGDIQDSFNSVMNIFTWYGDNQAELIPVAGKGHWNDPDMLIIGNFGLSYEQAKLQFALWAIMASPLLMSNDLRNIDSRSKEILLNREIIAVNQDSLGKQGQRVKKSATSATEIWFRPLSLCCSVAVVLLSLRSDLPVIVEASFDDDSFNSLVNIFTWYGDNQAELIPVAGKGHWNDPDMLIIGNFALSYEQAKLQFALWAIMASPLLMSNDLRNIDSRSKEILLNREIIAVNQDSLGKQGQRVKKSATSATEIWFRPLSLCCSVAVVLLSLRSDLPVIVEASFDDVGISTKRAYVRDLFAHQELGMYEGSFKAKVNPSGVVMVRLTPICDIPKKNVKTEKNKGETIKESKKTEKEKGETTIESKKNEKKKGETPITQEKSKNEKKEGEKAKENSKKEEGEKTQENSKKKVGGKTQEKSNKEKKQSGETKEQSKQLEKEKGEKGTKKKESENPKGELRKTEKMKGGKSKEKSHRKAGEKKKEKAKEKSNKIEERTEKKTKEESRSKAKDEKTKKERKWRSSENIDQKDNRKHCHCCVK